MEKFNGNQGYYSHFANEQDCATVNSCITTDLNAKSASISGTSTSSGTTTETLNEFNNILYDIAKVIVFVMK